MVLLKKIFKRLSAENVLSGVKEVTGNVAINCKSILMLGQRLVRRESESRAEFCFGILF
jgi:hypothetical protein